MLKSAMPAAHIGTSGFMYDHWRTNFYPEGLSKGKWLKYYTEKFSAVELNVTFYKLPKEETFLKWHKGTPEGFSFSLKVSRFITHIKRLLEPEEPVALFMERATLLRKKLAVVLWQFPPGFKADTGRLREFLEALRPYKKTRNAFEFRNETWLNREVVSLLEKADACLCMADWPAFLDDLPLTADFVYMRRHGEGGSYATSYSEEELRADARRIRKYLKAGRDVFVYFNNDAFGYAPKNALRLKELLGR